MFSNGQIVALKDTGEHGRVLGSDDKGNTIVDFREFGNSMHARTAVSTDELSPVRVKTRIAFTIRYLHGGDTVATIAAGTELTVINRMGEIYYIELDDELKTRAWIGKSKLDIKE